VMGIRSSQDVAIEDMEKEISQRNKEKGEAYDEETEEEQA